MNILHVEALRKSEEFGYVGGLDAYLSPLLSNYQRALSSLVFVVEHFFFREERRCFNPYRLRDVFYFMNMHRLIVHSKGIDPIHQMWGKLIFRPLSYLVRVRTSPTASGPSQRICKSDSLLLALRKNARVFYGGS